MDATLTQPADLTWDVADLCARLARIRRGVGGRG